ncbi:beta-galactosidase trimerization domain-containing protein [Paenibacillus sp. PAMC21692]|uniref:beta-galactosidase trimerization domain-containing protein n=1 Tax=Paenibacillus sp. PAMC21692 TaxID=2762320 RepID=UPI00164D78C4|nr:beta-galactosidase trimerization domain-containing protein [Paenibacillus sp. PAMC21692]QNK58949.1 beta-galactosidase trimerization domain-containing protein [Paenibacillus sp. PAMC21692]
MRTIKRAVHIDFHTMPDIPDFGTNFDAKAFARTLKDARVEYVNVFAKCNIGFAYYPTEIGVMHPYLNFDMFGQIVEECRKVGIGVTAYFNAGLDHEMARKHREWTVVNKEGQVIYGDRTENFFRNMCFNSGYREHLLAMVREVAQRYPVEGFFFDCMAVTPCYGNECLEGIREKGGDPQNDEDVRAFTKESLISFSRAVKEIIGDDKFLYLNGLSPADTEGLRTHNEIECLPSGWSYDFFPAQVAYARNLGQQTFYMTGRFNVNWGDFGGLKSKASLLNDCWDALMNGVPTSIGDHMHPRDGLDPAVYKVIGEIYEELERYEPWTDHVRVVADIGILTFAGGELADCHNGAVRMLGELKMTYDIINENHDLSAYKIIILPDDVRITSEFGQKLQSFIAMGGGIISSGHSGLNPEGTAFALGEWNMSYEGEDPWNSSYFRMLEDTLGEMPDMLCGIYSQGILLQAKEGAQEIAEYWQPYFNREWDGFHGSFYTPPDRYAGWQAVARSNNIIQFCFPVFGTYMEYAANAHKAMVAYSLRQLLPKPLLKCEGIPTTARVTVTEKEHKRIIHVKLTHPEPRGKYNVIEDLQTLNGAVVYLKGDNASSVYLAPGQEPLNHQFIDGYIRIPLPEVVGYAMVVVER